MTHWGSGGALLESGGAVLCAGGTWIPVVANGAFRSDDSLSGAALVGAADTFFAGLARGFTVKVRDSGEDEDLRLACEEAGLELFGDPVPEMICRTPLAETPPIDGVTIRMVDDEDGLRDFIAVNAEAYATYGMPPEVLTQLFDETPAVLLDAAASIVVARRDDEPVAAAMVYASDGVASLQWVGTVPAARAHRSRRLRHGGPHQPGLRRGRIVLLAPGLTDGGLRLHEARVRDRLPLRGVRSLAQAG